jgi:hypothetical protein
VATEPKYYVDTGVCKVTWAKDYIRTSSLYLPATFVATVLYLGISYELPFIRTLFNPLFLLALGAAPIVKVAQKVTEGFLFKVQQAFVHRTHRHAGMAVVPAWLTTRVLSSDTNG